MKLKNETLTLRRDYFVGFVAGFIIGVLLMPILNIIKPEAYSVLKLYIIPFFSIITLLGLFITQIISKKFPIFWQLGKFIVTGVLNVLVDFGSLTILTISAKKYFLIQSSEVIFNAFFFIISFYSIFKALSFIIANINSYFWNKYWTFNKTSQKKTNFIQFFIVSVFGFLINVISASLIFNHIPPIFNMNMEQWGLVGAGFGSIAGLFWNFIGYKFIVFKK